MMSSSQGSCRSCKGCVSTGLLILRVVVGALFIMHGAMKFGAPAEMAQFVGGVAHSLGLTFLSVETWFDIVKYVEVIGGGLLVLGLFQGLASTALLIVMLAAANAKGWDIQKAELDLLLIAILVSLHFTGPGRYSLKRLFHKSQMNAGVTTDGISCACCSDGCACGDCLKCQKTV